MKNERRGEESTAIKIEGRLGEQSFKDRHPRTYSNGIVRARPKVATQMDGVESSTRLVNVNCLIV